MAVEMKGIAWGACQLLFLKVNSECRYNCPGPAVEELAALSVLLDPRKSNC